MMDLQASFPNLPQHWSLASTDSSLSNEDSKVSTKASNRCYSHQRKRPLKQDKTRRNRYTVPLLLLASFSPSSEAFHQKVPTSLCPSYSDPRNTRCNNLQLPVVPISRFRADLTFLSLDESARICLDDMGKYRGEGQEEFELGLVEDEDLPDLARFIVAAFGADAIRLSGDMNAFERLLMSPAAELLNSYSTVVAFAEVFSGTKQRLQSRLKQMNLAPPPVKGRPNKEAIEIADSDSVVLVLARPSFDSNDSRIQIIASIELRLQPCDAKIPFSLPWLDKIERRLASIIGLGDGSARDLQPYLCNLCVDDKFRGQGLGRALVRCVESIAQDTWGYHRMYLHVDEDNIPALSLYQSEGYRDVGHRWNPFWAGSASAIGYYVKSLRSAKN